jgi:hypothetical protein
MFNNYSSLKIVEGIEGYYFYHLSESGKNMQQALCGNRNVMLTNLRLSSWGTKSHLNERYCKKCEELSKGKLCLNH